MKDLAILKEKRRHVIKIMRLCNLKRNELEIEVMIILLSFSSFLVSLWILWCYFGIGKTVFVVGILTVVFIVFPIYSKLKSVFKSTDERLYISVYTYTSPLPEDIKNKNYSIIMKLLSNHDIKDYYREYDYVRIESWAEVELEEINKLIYSQTKESELRKLILGKRNNMK